MPAQPNPFARRARRWGRPEEVRRQLQALVDGRPSFVLVGDERAGKSELLRLVGGGVDRVGHPVVVSTIDALVWVAETPDDQLTADAFWSEALAPLHRSAAAADPQIRRLLDDTAHRRHTSLTLTPLSLALYERGISLLVQVDNFDALLHGGLRELRPLLSAMRRLAGLSTQGILLTLASARRIDELNHNTEAFSAGSPFFNVFEQLVLSPLPSEEIEQILDLGGGDFTRGDRALIIRAAGGHPELVWRASERLWELLQRTHEPAERPLLLARDLLFRASPLLRSTWARWSPDARVLLLRGLLDELGASEPTHESESDAPEGDLRLAERLCERVRDQHELLALLRLIDTTLVYELPAATVPLRHLADEAVALLRRRDLLDLALPRLLGGPVSRSGMHLGLLPAATEHLRRTGWIELRGPQRPQIRVRLLAWWLLDGLAPLARGHLSLNHWAQHHQIELSAPLSRSILAGVAAARPRLAQGAAPWILEVSADD